MDERTEQLISRRLDGEITEEESLELDKRLIRSPEARTYLEDQERINALAAESLRAALAPGDTPLPRKLESADWPARVGLWRRYLRPATAVAAVIVVAALVASLPFGRSQPSAVMPLTANNDPGASRQTAPPGITIPVDSNWSGLPGAGRHEVIGVYDDDTQSLYLLEMSRRSGTDSHAAMDF
jgi:anti-sigma factor RsiW